MKWNNNIETHLSLTNVAATNEVQILEGGFPFRER